MRINDQIDARQVRLIDENGGQLGVLTLDEALALANTKQLDLVEVAPQTTPAVCKLMDYGRHTYQEKKRRNEARNKQRSVLTKVVKFRPNTFKGDYAVKTERIRRFLEAGDKVKVIMQFRGREIIHAQHGFEVFTRLAAELTDCCTVDSAPSTEGRFLNMVLVALPERLRKANGSDDPNGHSESAADHKHDD